MGYDTVVSERSYVSFVQGLKQGAAIGVLVGTVYFSPFLLMTIQEVKGHLLSASWRPLLVIWLALPLLSGLFGGLGGILAARTRLQPWSKQARNIAPHHFGPGSQHGFNWYLQHDSTVPVKSVDEICRWLQDCRYTTDQEQFHTPDYWQHPTEFEQTRTGDCEDHALWAWRKLIGLGYSAEMIVGTSYRHNLQGEYHAWVVFTHQQRHYLLEAARKDAPMIAPLIKVQHLYVPDFGVDEQLQTYAYRRQVNARKA